MALLCKKNKWNFEMRHHNMKIWSKCGTNFPDNSKTIESIIMKFEDYFFMLDAIISKSNSTSVWWFTPVTNL